MRVAHDQRGPLEHSGDSRNVEAAGSKEAKATEDESELKDDDLEKESVTLWCPYEEKVPRGEILKRQAISDLKKWMHELKECLEDLLTFDRRGQGGEECNQVHMNKIAMLMDLSLDMEEVQSQSDTMATWQRWKSERESIKTAEEDIMQRYRADPSMGCVDVYQVGHTSHLCEWGIRRARLRGDPGHHREHR